VEIFDILGAAFPPPPAPIDVKFCTAKRTQVSVGPAKFELNRCNESPLRGEKPDFWPVSKNNTGSLPLRGILPVISQLRIVESLGSSLSGRYRECFAIELSHYHGCFVGPRSKRVASMRQDETIASSCFRRRQIFAHLFHDKASSSILINIQVAD